MRRRLAILLLCMSVILAGGVAEATDVLGWQQTRWGMTEEEVKASLREEVVRFKEPRRYIGLYAPFGSKILIDYFPLEVVFQFSNETKRLEQILIMATDFDGSQYDRLLSLLSQKYGPPVMTGKQMATWKFPTTIIELERVRLPGFRQTGIRYFPASKLKDEKEKL